MGNDKMEHKYIDAEALMEVIIDSPPDHVQEVSISGDIDTIDFLDKDTIAEIISEMPVADVKPVIHGTWEYADYPHKTSNRFCSVCGRAEKIYAYNRDDFGYCRCGAKMDGGSEE